jgi:hypothetical protein
MRLHEAAFEANCSGGAYRVVRLRGRDAITS